MKHQEIELYHADYSTCSQKVRLTLAEKGLEYQSIALSFRKEQQLSADYLKINPNGVVPSLVDQGKIITDSSSIIEYLDEKFDAFSLSSSLAHERAEIRSWLRFMEEVPTVAIRTPSFDQVFLPTLRLIKGKKAFNESVDKRTLRKNFYKDMNSGQGFSDEKFEESIRLLTLTIERMESALQRGQWILGERITLVDISLLPLVDRMQDLGMVFLWENNPQVACWLSRMQSRDSYKKAFYRGSRLSERFEFKLGIYNARKRNRDYASRSKRIG